MQHFRTISGEPPNGGVPPGTMFYPVPVPAAAPPTVSPPPPPYCIHPCCTHVDPRMWLPPQQVPSPPYFSAPPAPPPTSARWTPPGATLLGNAAPTIDGVEYLYPKDHTLFHIIWDRFMELDKPIYTPVFEPKMFPSGLTVKDLIQRLGAPDNDDSKYGMTEVHELGDGRWTAGQTILLNSDYAKKTLREVGWDETRGFSAKPVWIKVYSEA